MESVSGSARDPLHSERFGAAENCTQLVPDRLRDRMVSDHAAGEGVLPPTTLPRIARLAAAAATDLGVTMP